MLSFDSNYFYTNQYNSITETGKKKILSVRNIFADNDNWERYKSANSGIISDWVIKKFDKMLKCQNSELGYLKYECKRCKKTKSKKLSCNLRICSRFGKRYTDNWSQILAKEISPIPHRHFILTMPAELCPIFEKDTDLWKLLLDTVQITFKNVVNWKRNNKKLKFGLICALHIYGNDLKFNPHAHVIITEGYMDKYGKWQKHFYFNYNSMRRVWQYNILKGIKNKYRNDNTISVLVNEMFQKYKNGFVIDGKRRISNVKEVAKYIIRYVRHPSIADSRIQSYDGKEVQFRYKRRVDGIITYYEKIMKVEDFIEAIIKFIPPKNFKIIRYYGIYSRRGKKKLRVLIDQLVGSYGSLRFYKYPSKSKKGHKIRKIINCSICGGRMKLIETYFNRDYG